MSRDLLTLDWQDFDYAIDELAHWLRPFASAAMGIYGAPRGGLPLAVALSHRLNLPLLMEPAQGMIFVDDIVDTGKTLEQHLPLAVACAAWILRGTSHTYTNPPLFVAELLPTDEWVVFPWEPIVGAATESEAYALSRQ